MVNGKEKEATIKKLIKLLFIFVAFQLVMMIFGYILKKRYLSQAVGEDEVNAVGITGGAVKKITTQAFKGGYVRAIMGGLDLDLREAAIKTPPATIEATVVMGGGEIKVPQNWQLKNETQAILGGVQDTRKQEKPSAETTPDLIITGKVIMGGLAIS